jgi:glycosyltransferase involved in cell wall biosynthesis
MTRVTAIVTTYNVERYVASALQSVLDAGFEDLELILVDDGSTDATRHVAEVITAGGPLGLRYEPVYFARNTIGGVASAGNAGLDRATGEVVIFIDGDDWVVPHALKRGVERLIETDADFVVCGCQEFWNGTGEYTYYPEASLWGQVKLETSLERRRALLLQMAPFPWRKIYRRSFLERHKIRFPVGDYFFEDNPFHWETSLRAENFLFFEPVTHVHRMARQGQTVTSMGQKPLQIFEHAKTIRQMIGRVRTCAALEEQYQNWLIKHILWCARHVSPSALNSLYDMARLAIAEVPDEDYYTVIASQDLQRFEVVQLTAIRIGDRLGFLNAVPSGDVL